MPYEIRHTDEINKGIIIVEDREINDDNTSLSFPGKGVTNYGKVIAENSLHMLENFAFPLPPSNPVEGQLWYDTSTGVDQLKLYDGTGWVPASGVFRATTSPEVTSAIAGDLWVDTDNQQLYLNSGAGWILVGPEFSAGSSTGPRVALLAGTDNVNYTVLILDVNEVPMIILSANRFTPKSTIAGFTEIFPGANLSNRSLSGNLLKYRGLSESAESLRIGVENVASTNFLRADTDSTTTGILRVKNDVGLQVGANGQLSLQSSGERAVIRNNFSGSSLDLQVKQDSDYVPGIRIKSNPGALPTIGVNNQNPLDTLDVTGTFRVSDIVKINSTVETTGTETGALQVKGGVWIAKDLRTSEDSNVYVGNNLNVGKNITGSASEMSGFNTITANTFIGNVQGSLVGTVTGSASSATKLTSRTRFEIIGDVTSQPVLFDGAGDLTKTFNTTLSNDFISNKDSTTASLKDDEIIINRTTGNTGLYRIQQRDLVKNVPTNPVGMIAPYAGTAPPPGWRFCDGSIIPKSDANDLWLLIGHRFLDPSNFPSQVSSTSNFALPDLRGRFPLGLDNMGGSPADRVTDLAADALGNAGGKQNADVEKRHLPQHEHDLRSSGVNAKQYYAIRDAALDAVNDSPEVTALNIQTGISAVSGIPTSGKITDGGVTGNDDYRTVNGELVGAPLETMNPYLSINYIIWTGIV